MKRLLPLVLLLGACDTTTSSGDGGNGVADMVTLADHTINSEAYFYNDPPPSYCSADGAVYTPTVVPGGSVECPDDKNREGCPCYEQDKTAPCWPGPRVRRGIGNCKDGTTTCKLSNELELRWGPCVGAVLPVENASSGAAQCSCFSAGTWKLDNIVPCQWDMGTGGAVSTTIGAGGQPECPKTFAKPSAPWSQATLTSDCPGTYKLCLTLKGGSIKDPKPTDCVITTVCTEGYYTEAGKEQSFPPLPAWIADSAEQKACATSFAANGGYGEMSVEGSTMTCEAVKRPFHRIGYCPLKCGTMSTGAECKDCNIGVPVPF